MNIDILVYKAQKSPNRLNPKRIFMNHILLKILNIKKGEGEREFWKQQEKKQLTTCRGIIRQLSVGFSAKTLQVKKEQDDTFNIKRKKLPTRNTVTNKIVLQTWKRGTLPNKNIRNFDKSYINITQSLLLLNSLKWNISECRNSPLWKGEETYK